MTIRGDGAIGGQYCHAECSEASRDPSKQTLRFAQGDTIRNLQLRLIGDMHLHSPNALPPSKVLSRTLLQTHYKGRLLAYALHSY
jgi:hypothetical protein